VVGKGIERGLVRVDVHNIRDYALDKHKTTDDTPYGGGAGMVMKPGPIVDALEALEAAELAAGRPRPYRVALTPGGRPFCHEDAPRLAQMESVAMVCGRYEGIDERVMDFVDEEISLGDFVLTGGEPAALAIIDAAVRFVPGVLGNAQSVQDESFGSGRLEYPQFTRPRTFRGAEVPEILCSGDHLRVDRWRQTQALLRTLARRPGLFVCRSIDEEELVLLDEAGLDRADVLERIGAAGSKEVGS
jgi:tRNA (guanine37-N1)-methyltransferase